MSFIWTGNFPVGRMFVLAPNRRLNALVKHQDILPKLQVAADFNPILQPFRLRLPRIMAFMRRWGFGRNRYRFVKYP
ncbi:MAG: hypothetical protein N3B10_14515 [Armatimonadetes bacterium]|nr:hypothetical protein [Armatimonadota bacterium]